jgi:DNA-binding ferritin-like protein (Dps family)
MSDTGKSGFFSKVVGDKRRWLAYKARVKKLPPDYRAAVDAIERYLMYFGGVADADSAASLFEDVADLFEQAAADETPIREIVGEDPVEFVDALVRNYEKGGYIDRERERLVKGIETAERGQENR